MTAKILDGRSIARAIRQDLAKKIAIATLNSNRAPGLAVILVGDDDASKLYVENKKKACLEVGIQSKAYNLPSSISEKELVKIIHELNNDDTIDGILVQLPLPEHINSDLIVESIDPLKDVDGFHPFNFGKLAQNRPFLRPCTPAGIMILLEHTKVNLQGKDAVIIGTSRIVGRPMILELLPAGVTTTSCHKQTKDLATKVQHADIVISATGNPHLVKGDWIKPGSIVIDVGMNRLANGKLVGDVEFTSAKEKAAWITPVPGGVGPMTIVTLLQNTVCAYEN